MARVAIVAVVLVALVAGAAADGIFPTGKTATYTGMLWAMNGDDGSSNVCTPYSSAFPASVQFGASAVTVFIPWAKGPAKLAVNVTQPNTVWKISTGAWTASGNGGAFWGSGKDLNTTNGIYNISKVAMGPLGDVDMLDFTICTYTSHFGKKSLPFPGQGPSCDANKRCWKAAGWKRSTDQMAWLGIDDTYCQTYCNRAGAQCGGAQELHIGSRSQCIQKCQGWQATSGLGAAEPDMVGANIGYNSVQCRMTQLDAALASVTGNCMAANATSAVCAAPAAICNRFCDAVTATCTGVGFYKKAYADKTACLTACSNYTMPPTQAIGPGAFGQNTLQCRIAALYGLQDPAIKAAENLYGSVMCKSAGVSGGAFCGKDNTAGWPGTYKEVVGYCTPGKALGGCCCNRGDMNITVIGPNNLRLVVNLDGGPACANNKVLDVSYFYLDDNAKEAYTAFSVSGIQVSVKAVLRKENNEVSVINSIAPATCGSFACKELGTAQCTAAVVPASSSTGVIEFSAAPALLATSPLALLAAAALALFAAKRV